MQSQMVVPILIPSRSESMVKTVCRSLCRISRMAWRHTVAITFEQSLGETTGFELYVGRFLGKSSGRSELLQGQKAFCFASPLSRASDQGDPKRRAECQCKPTPELSHTES